MRNTNKAVFLDRDGTINYDTGYLYQPERLRLIPGAAEAIAQLNRLGFLVIVVTNQSGVARGFYTENDVKKLHLCLQDTLADEDAHIDAFYYCPHHPDAVLMQYRSSCICRKPNPGMLWQAMKDFSLLPEQCFMVGDSLTDVLAGKAAQCRANILVAPKHSLADIEANTQAFTVVPGISEAVEIISIFERDGE